MHARLQAGSCKNIQCLRCHRVTNALIHLENGGKFGIRWCQYCLLGRANLEQEFKLTEMRPTPRAEVQLALELTLL